MEDSLYWIAYATQPSNIKTHAIDPSPLIPSGDATTSTTAGVVTEGQTTAAAGSVGAGGTSVTGLTVQQASKLAKTAESNQELRRRIAVEALGLAQRVPRVAKQCLHEEERISRLAAVMQVC